MLWELKNSGQKKKHRNIGGKQPEVNNGLTMIQQQTKIETIDVRAHRRPDRGGKPFSSIFETKD